MRALAARRLQNKNMTDVSGSAPRRPWTSRYAPGVPDDIELPTGSLVDIIEASVREYPRKVALEFFRATTTYAELGEQVDRAAEGLRMLGVKAGDPVAIVLPNCPQHVVAFYAVLRLGAIVVEHNPLYTPRELRHQFEDHGAKTVIAWDKVVSTIQTFPPDVHVDRIISVDLTRAMPLSTRIALRLPVKRARESRAALTTEVPTSRHGVRSWSDIVDSRKISRKVPKPGRDDIAVIQYTSGTTGLPKGAVLTHLNLGANAVQATAWVPSVERGDAVVYGVLPMFHAFGLTLCLTFAMRLGARLVLFPKFDPDLVLAAIRKNPPTFLAAVPPIFERLTRAALAKKQSLAGIPIAISGAMPLTAAIAGAWERSTGGIVVEGYGLSETSPVLIANPVSKDRLIGSIGVPLPGTEVRIVDPENPMIERPPGEAGELIVRGPQVFRGYWRKAEETRAVFVEDAQGASWFRTGDIATIDAEGVIRIVDRLKELIIISGFKVSPSEVEEALRGHESVADVAVVGLPHDLSGEDVAAAIVLAPGAQLDAKAIAAFAREHLAAYKVPHVIVQIDELPKSLIGKVLRKKVRDELLAMRDSSTL